MKAKIPLTALQLALSPNIQAQLVAYKTLDISWARRMLPQAATTPHGDLLIAMHKARYECKYLEDEYRHKSRDWLEGRGHLRVREQPWPTRGELP
jgi:hypothetical protein